MWKRFARWIQLPTQKRPVHRRTRGNLEPLESRTVLSATFYEPPIDSEPSATGVWASGYEAIARPAWFSSDDAVLHGSAPMPAATPENLHEGFWHGDRPIWRPPSGAYASQLQGPNYVWTVIVIYVPSFEAPSAHIDVSGSASELAPTNIPKPIAATSPHVDTPDEPPPRPPQLAQFLVDSASSFVDLLSTSNIGTSTISRAATTSLVTAETAFQEATSDLLLLTEVVEDRDDIELDDLNDDLEAVSNNQDDEFTEFGDRELNETVARSLELLDSELEAIDAALADLHDIETRDDQAKNDAAEADRQPVFPMPLIAGNGSLPTDAAEEIETAPNDVGEGGMVLLEAIGDANVSAFDLAGVFVVQFEEAAEVPLGVEMSVGVYQAVDVGGAESRPSAENTSAVPASAARRSSATSAGESNTGGKQPS